MILFGGSCEGKNGNSRNLANDFSEENKDSIGNWSWSHLCDSLFKNLSIFYLCPEKLNKIDWIYFYICFS